jgi:hypothetical protein
MGELPPPLAGTALRILATSDLGAAAVPMRTSHGLAGTCAGVAALLERERERVAAEWFDVGDLVVGNPAYVLTGERPWEDVARLPIAVTTAGNHEFDDGLDALRAAAARLSYPMLCANADVGLAATAVIGDVGVIGLTHPRCPDLSQCPALRDDGDLRVTELARELRRAGARWIVVLLHDGVTFWPAAHDGVETRSAYLEGVAQPWAAAVDLILCGHNFAAWTGELAGTPAGEPHLFAASVVVVDLGEQVHVRGVFRVPPVPSHTPTAATEAVEAAAARPAGSLPDQWLIRTGAQHYLPHLLADAFRAATGADAGFAVPNFHGIQAPVDGAIAALGPGPVSELDVLRLVAAPDFDLHVVELEGGELEAAATRHWELADPRNHAADAIAQNWCRMPTATSGAHGAAGGTLAIIPAVTAFLERWLGRELDAHDTGIPAADAIVQRIA